MSASDPQAVLKDERGMFVPFFPDDLRFQAAVHSLPSCEYQTSPQFCEGSSDQPPSTHMRSRYTTEENQNRGGHGAASVSCRHSTPSAELQTSFYASYSGT